MTDADERWMACAIYMAERGLGTTAPNPSVGAVITDAAGTTLIARGRTAIGGRPHAETEALMRAGDAARGATLYVTLEPCSHHGKTPPCTEAIIAAGIARVVYGLTDPDPRVSGRGLALLRAAGILVDGPVAAARCSRLTRGHVLRVTQRRPFVQAKLAVGANGLVPFGHGGVPLFVTGEAAKVRTHLLRAQTDAILTGIGTVIADDPELTCRLPGMAARSPIRLVLDTRLRVPLGSRLVQAARQTPVWVLTAPEHRNSAAARALEEAGVRVLPYLSGESHATGVRNVLHHLAEGGITRVLIEAGPQLARAAHDGGVIDEYILYRGRGVVPPSRGVPLSEIWPTDVIAALNQSNDPAGADYIHSIDSQIG